MNVSVYDNRIEETFDYKINCLQQINDNHPYILIAPTQNKATHIAESLTRLLLTKYYTTQKTGTGKQASSLFLQFYLNLSQRFILENPKFDRNNRTSLGHVQKVEYIVAITL